MGRTVALFFFLNLIFVELKCDDSECEVAYSLKITSSINSCDNFDNDFMDCTGLVLGAQKGDDGSEGKLGGKVVTSAEISCDFECEVDIWKVQDMGNEYMYNMRVNFGTSLKDTDAPWYPVFQNLNISECPVPSDLYEIADMKLSLDSLKDVLTHDFCGDYQIQFSFVDVTDKLSCHKLDICIIEIENDDC